MKRATEHKESLVPKQYRRVNIKYSHLGVDDFDFAHYNKTPFCGLEIHIPNAYCNAMLQVISLFLSFSFLFLS
jgi:PAB-dependent poly(A)-specific ribonuclease subunit 2